VPVCSICGRSPEDVGLLCLMECPFEKGRPWYECAACIRQGEMFREDMKAVQEDVDLWADHVRECSFCYQNKGLMPRMALFQTCHERRKVKEALAKEEVTV
jgi:hypothetical protein